MENWQWSMILDNKRMIIEKTILPQKKKERYYRPTSMKSARKLKSRPRLTTASMLARLNWLLISKSKFSNWKDTRPSVNTTTRLTRIHSPRITTIKSRIEFRKSECWRLLIRMRSIRERFSLEIRWILRLLSTWLWCNLWILSMRRRLRPWTKKRREGNNNTWRRLIMKNWGISRK